jgi:alcohol dehydrogenase class IV
MENAMKAPTIGYLTDIYFESGALSVLPELLDKLSVKRPLLVTDKGLTAMGFSASLGVSLGAVFDAIETNPTETSVLAGLAIYRENQCDGLVALGGGSPMDCAKCIGLLVHHPQPLSDYAFLNGGLAKITDHKPPLIAIPTTAGTGSEVGRAALVTMHSGRKMAFLSPKLIPSAVICDPTLTLKLPKSLTAGTGMDAITHCVETFCSPKFNPVADAIALDGLQRAYANIQAAVHDGSNLGVRSEMMMAALEGGMTFQKGLGMVHSLSHPLGGLTEKRPHHGTLNAIFLPHVLRFNMEACGDRLDTMARALGVGTGRRLPEAFEALSASLAVPTRLRDLNLTMNDLEGMAELAVQDHCSLTNPRKITVEDCRQMLQAAL